VDTSSKIGAEKRKKQIAKEVDAFVTVVLIDPIAIPLARILAKLRVHPNNITVIGILVAISAAVLFAIGPSYWPLASVMYYISILLDCVDGKVARATGKVSRFGKLLDDLGTNATYAMAGLTMWGAQSQNIAISALGIIGIVLNVERCIVSQAVHGKIRENIKRIGNTRVAMTITGMDIDFMAFAILPILGTYMQIPPQVVAICAILLKVAYTTASIIAGIRKARKMEEML